MGGLPGLVGGLLLHGVDLHGHVQILVVLVIGVHVAHVVPADGNAVGDNVVDGVHDTVIAGLAVEVEGHGVAVDGVLHGIVAVVAGQEDGGVALVVVTIQSPLEVVFVVSNILVGHFVGIDVGGGAVAVADVPVIVAGGGGHEALVVDVAVGLAGAGLVEAQHLVDGQLILVLVQGVEDHGSHGGVQVVVGDIVVVIHVAGAQIILQSSLGSKSIALVAA